ncbi:flagellar filament capping protein FliD [Ruminiclostridium cellobioparum]|uniref:flagellar filament capping protein FliD n=1 Tax=Ruminiclostridium cellobioparum TaxID=29355 RepID=UPI0028AA0470|nr:flagellar filament capping protein FliD [Ruminiclostridium cellobioparum]
MATNGITNALNTRMRLSGLASGLDTDTLVKQIMAREQAKLDKIKQKQQIDLWKTDAYREVTSSLQSFYNEYFDTLSSKNLKSANNFASFSTSYAATTSTDYVTVTAGASARAGTYKITLTTKATAAALSSTGSVTGDVFGINVDETFAKEISSANNNNVFVLTLNNVSKQITLENGTALDSTYVDKMQKAIDDAFGAGKIILGTAKDASGNITTETGKPLKIFTARGTDSFSIGKAYNTGADDIFSANPTEDDPLTIGSDNNKFVLKIGTDAYTVTIAKGTYKSAGALAAMVQEAAESAVGGAHNITFSGASGKVTYSTTDPGGASVSNLEIDANSVLGFDISKTPMGNKIDLNAKIFDSVGQFGEGSPLDVDGTSEDITFSINGKYFRFNSKTTSMNDIMKAVNADTTINATMKYDLTTNTFKIESRSTGVTSKLAIKDVSGNLMAALKINIPADPVQGTDAGITVEGISDEPVTIVRPNNSFTYDGLTFDIKADFTSGGTVEPIKATVVSDPTKTFDYIKTFVDKYNELIDKINDKINEKVNRDYAPLTDEQKESLSEDQIEKWEEKAKSGLLKNDSILSGIVTQLRSALYAAVEGAGVSLSSIGITTSSNYEDKGKLVISESKLKEALTNRSEDISKLFTNSSTVSYYESINNSTLKSQRYKESGIAQRFSDIIQDAIRTSTNNNGAKGSLLEKAGMEGDRSESTNLLYKEIMEFDSQIAEMNKRLLEKENALYEKFAKMESAMEKMNSQQSWLMQQFGGGS